MVRSRRPIAGEEVASHYDELDAFYRDVWGDHVHHGYWISGKESRAEAVRKLVGIVAAQAGIQPGMRVCDIGCGYGATSRMLAREFGAEVTGITISGAQYRFAAAQENGNATFHQGDWMVADLPESHFDAAIAIESSEHMPDLRRFFQQARRVLRPGAKLVVCAWLASDSASARQKKRLLEPICREGRMPLMGAFADYETAAESSGFNVLDKKDATRNVVRTWPVIAALFCRKLLSNPAYLRYLLDRHARNRIFALTMFRIWVAYRTGAMRYGILTAEAPR